MKLAVIPARGGSKRIPRKNIRAFLGRPIIAYAIEAAREAGCFDRIVVSTDDEEVAAVSREAGAEVPFMRPAALADDFTGTADVVRHAIAWHREHGDDVEIACCIYATAPFVTADVLRDGLAQLEQAGVDFAFSVTTFPFPVLRALKRSARGNVQPMFPEHIGSRSQDLEEAFHDAGQFYWGRAQAFLDSRPLYGPSSIGIVLPRHRVQDIDTPEDWRRAEIMYELLQRSRS